MVTVFLAHFLPVSRHSIAIIKHQSPNRTVLVVIYVHSHGKGKTVMSSFEPELIEKYGGGEGERGGTVSTSYGQKVNDDVTL